MLTPTSYLLLGMINLGSRTGYDIKALADKSSRFFWATSYGQIYPELKRLEEAGLIRGEHSPAGGRRRRAYELTAGGEQALHAWLASDTELTYELRDEGLLRLFFADAMAPDEVVEHLRRMRRRHEDVAERLDGIGEHAASMPQRYPAVCARFGRDFHRWIADWCAEAERDMTDREAPG